MLTANTKALREDSRDWWYHKRLRKEGKASEAREHERFNLVRDVAMIRKVIREGGFQIINYSYNCLYAVNESLSRYSARMAAALCQIGVTTVDTRSVPPMNLRKVFLMLRGVPVAGKWTKWDVPITLLLPRYIELGATVYVSGSVLESAQAHYLARTLKQLQGLKQT